MIVYYTAIALIGIPGNILILVFFKTSTQHKSSTYRYFILQLALADLVSCAMVPVTKTPQLLVKGRWVMEDFACSVLMPITWMIIAVSSWILCALCYDRYTAIARPFADRLSKRKITVVCVCIWLLAIAFYSPYIFFTEIEDGYCSRLYQDNIRHLTRYLDFCKDIVKGYGPMTASLTLLYKMNASLKARGKEAALVQTIRTHSTRRRLAKTYKFVAMTTLSFVVCLLPSTILNGVKNLAYNKPIVIHMGVRQLEILDKILGWAWALSYMNSAINCFIYAGRFPKFRRFIKRCFDKTQN